jgi:NADH:ubiquinone oxidoreductase subunit 2 (subunit N)
LLWIVVLAILGSAISLYYYLQILKQAFVVEDASVATSSITVGFIQRVAILLLAAAVLFFGCFPNLLLRRLDVPGSAAPSQQHDHDHPTEETAAKSSLFLADLR